MTYGTFAVAKTEDGTDQFLVVAYPVGSEDPAWPPIGTSSAADELSAAKEVADRHGYRLTSEEPVAWGAEETYWRVERATL
jgi:hypothetical protein